MDAITQGTVTTGDKYSVFYIGESLIFDGWYSQVTAQVVIDSVVSIAKADAEFIALVPATSDDA